MRLPRCLTSSSGFTGRTSTDRLGHRWRGLRPRACTRRAGPPGPPCVVPAGSHRYSRPRLRSDDGNLHVEQSLGAAMVIDDPAFHDGRLPCRSEAHGSTTRLERHARSWSPDDEAQSRMGRTPSPRVSPNSAWGLATTDPAPPLEAPATNPRLSLEAHATAPTIVPPAGWLPALVRRSPTLSRLAPRVRIREHLKEIKRHAATVVTVDRSVTMRLGLGSRVSWFEERQILPDGPADEVLDASDDSEEGDGD